MDSRIITLALITLLIQPLEAMEWRRAELYGADVRSLVIAPGNPDLVFLGTSQGEVYVSRDGGSSWKNPRESVPFPGYVIDNLAIDEEGYLWVAGWGLWSGGLIAVSRDGGLTWERRDRGIEDLSIRAFSLVTGEKDTLIVGGLTGVYRSRDRGHSWEKISSRENVESLAVDPRTPDTIYIGTWRQMWRTDDGGQSWRHIANGMVLDTDVFGISIDPRNPDDVWLSTCGWVYHSKDRGEHWDRYRDGFQNRRVHVVERDLANPNAIWAGSVAGLYRTIDLGKSWSLVTGEELAINAIAIHPEQPLRMILGTEGDGIYVSDDRGETFSRSSRGLYSVKVSTIATDPRNQGRLLAGIRNGRAAAVYESRDHGESWAQLSESALPPILTIELHQLTDDRRRLIAGTESGIFYSDDEGVSWSRAQPVAEPARVERILSYTSRRLFASTSDGVFTSNDGALSWWRLDGSWIHARGLATGQWLGKPALFAVHSAGLAAYNEDGWHDVHDSPGGSEVIALRLDGRQMILIGDSYRWIAGLIDDGRWQKAPLQIPEGSTLVMTPKGPYRFASNGERHLFVGEGIEGVLTPTGLSCSAREISDIEIDPFDSNLLYLATTSSGILILDRSPASEVESKK